MSNSILIGLLLQLAVFAAWALPLEDDAVDLRADPHPDLGLNTVSQLLHLYIFSIFYKFYDLQCRMY